MSDNAPGSYGEAWAVAEAMLRAGKLADPDEHFPYKHEQVSELIAENPPAGRRGPDDDSVRISDFISQDIADASKAYIDAQAAYLADPTRANRRRYEVEKELLVAARRTHREGLGR